jgi:hypothetical protein
VDPKFAARGKRTNILIHPFLTILATLLELLSFVPDLFLKPLIFFEGGNQAATAGPGWLFGKLPAVLE